MHLNLRGCFSNTVLFTPPLHCVPWGQGIREDLIFLDLVIPRVVSGPQSSEDIIQEVSGALSI